jgi:hypothetical protein
MDFVARAGAVIDRAHRVSGILLILVIVLGIFSSCEFAKNQQLNSDLLERRIRYPVIVVPDATTGVYSPTEEDRLISLFSDFVTQSLNTFTNVNVGTLYTGLRPYMGPSLLTDSEPYFQRKIRDANADKRSSFFVPDRARPLSVTKRRVNDQDFRDVTIYGQLNAIIGGVTAESVPMQMDMTFQKVFASPANPYGFILTAYHEKPLVDTVKTPVLPSGVPTQ